MPAGVHAAMVAMPLQKNEHLNPAWHSAEPIVAGSVHDFSQYRALTAPAHAPSWPLQRKPAPQSESRVQYFLQKLRVPP
jgi:hypothetical protein